MLILNVVHDTGLNSYFAKGSFGWRSSWWPKRSGPSVFCQRQLEPFLHHTPPQPH
uniref:Uncharacterized protein n=1 Tax=Oryza brachyantha TaxID=4533 RepID=J3KYV6_ORYBR